MALLLGRGRQERARSMSCQSSEKLRERRETYFSGRVQGVGFRYTARSIASRYAVTGFVQNLNDGRVLLVAEGEQRDIDGLLQDLRAEIACFVRGEQTATLPAIGEFHDFSILPTA